MIRPGATSGVALLHWTKWPAAAGWRKHRKVRISVEVGDLKRRTPVKLPAGLTGIGDGAFPAPTPSERPRRCMLVAPCAPPKPVPPPPIARGTLCPGHVLVPWAHSPIWSRQHPIFVSLIQIASYKR